jgi:hypothetical protein
MARARFGLHQCEAKKHELDRMISALDRRFSVLWSRES